MKRISIVLDLDPDLFYDALMRRMKELGAFSRAAMALDSVYQSVG
jgi:hypothetical protein